MFSFNSYYRATALGRLGKDIEVKEIGEKKSKVVSFGVAVDTYDPKAENKKGVIWVNCQSFNEQIVKNAPLYAKKGAIVLVSGEPRTRKYTKDGVEKEISDLSVFDMVKVSDGGKPAPQEESATAAPQTTAAAPTAPANSDPDLDIPF